MCVFRAHFSVLMCSKTISHQGFALLTPMHPPFQNPIVRILSNASESILINIAHLSWIEIFKKIALIIHVYIVSLSLVCLYFLLGWIWFIIKLPLYESGRSPWHLYRTNVLFMAPVCDYKVSWSCYHFFTNLRSLSVQLYI